MSFQLNIPPSVLTKLAKQEEEDEGESSKTPAQRREDFKKLKELEEARKAGTEPAMKDEEGNDINPHIPQYIMQAPWYIGATQATLKHQRSTTRETTKLYAGLNDWYTKGVKGVTANKYRKGACENCGAMTHKRKDCLERPRKIGARFTGTEIAPDEYIQPDLEFNYEGKRDRWNGYDPGLHKRVIDEYVKIEEAKKLLKAQNLETSMEKGADESVVEKVLAADGEDEDKYADDIDMPGQKFETKQRITVRNLRIREDTAKYLYNLDTNSAHYDPKTRSMRENPFGIGTDPTELKYSGDNFVRFSGDANAMAKQQMFAWEAYEKNQDVHLQADPTKLEILAREFQKRKEIYKTDIKKGLVDVYGGAEHLEGPPKQLLMAQTEEYIEYSRSGTVVKGMEKAAIKSRYEEDIYNNNHKSVWGSYWRDFQWGYKCCHSLVKESYCTGDAGIEAEKISYALAAPAESFSPEKSLSSSKKQKQKSQKKRKHKKKHHKKDSSSSDSTSESETEEGKRERLVQKAMKKLEEDEKNAEKLLSVEERKRPYNVMYDDKAPSEDLLEAYKRKRLREDDPMANFK